MTPRATTRPASRSTLRVPLDLPPGRLEATIGAMPGAAMLGGGPGFGEAGRWSLLAARPRLRFEATDSGWSIRGLGLDADGRGDVLGALGGLIDRLGLSEPVEPAVEADAPPFLGGLIGFFGYDLAPMLERLPRKAPRDSLLPDVRFALFDTFAAVDHETGEAALIAVDLLGEGPLAVDRRARRWLDDLRRPSPRIPRSSFEGPPAADRSPEEHREAVRRTIDYIAAGDIFQANLSQRFVARGRPEPLDLYRRLRSRSPAPFSAMLRCGPGMAVVSSSPEWFYRTRGDRIVTRPIKGTRPRGATAEEDAAQIEALRNSPKDRAELTMIVDLERNDLGRVCAFGTVRVLEPMAIETYAQVHHLVATVEGRLRPGVGPMEVVRAVFPGGSITGAPKIRAMEIIDELEPTRRSLYTGAIGYYGLGGASAFNIAIRTLLLEGDRVSYQVGGGIVADSDPQLEYEETLHKGRGIRDVLEGRA